MLARELGGRVSGITLACTGMLGSLFFLAVGNFYSPNVYEPLFWTGAIYLLCRIINGAPSRTWIWLGAVAGLGIQNKHSMVFFGVAIALAILLTPERRQFGQKLIWLTGLIAFVIALPNIIWQIERSWPTWVLLHGIAQSHKNVALTPWEFFAQQITLMNPATFPLWFGGLIWLLASREGRRYRVIAFTYLIALAEFIVMHAKNYYLAPAYPMLFAAGGVAFEKFSRFASDGLNRPLRFSSLSRRSFSRRSCFPFYDRKDCSLHARDSFRGPTDGNIAYRGVAPALCRSIRLGRNGALGGAGLRQLPPEEQKRAAIFCQNYGEAGAIDFFGSKYGLPPALSGHQNYFYWGPDDYTGEIMIVLDDDATDEREQFRSVEDRGPVETSPWAMPYEQH